MALHFAERGWKLFPCRYDEKRKKHQPLVSWPKESSDDHKVIKGWEEHFGKRHHKIYYCVNLKASNLTVVDIDNKHNKRGSASIVDLKMAGKHLPDTLTIRTPSAGYHQFYETAAPFSANKLADGIDTPVMVPVPGSIVPYKGIYQVVHDIPLQELPEWVLTDLAQYERDKHAAPVVDEDMPDAILAAIRAAKDAPPAIAHQGGNAQTYAVACSLFEEGISLDMCKEIMADYYNPTCEPPWDLDELYRIVENAHEYKINATGIRSVAADFPPIDHVVKYSLSDLDIRKVAHHRWIIPGRYCRGFVTATVAAGGVGKSAYVQNEALSIATNKELLGLAIEEPTNVWLYNLEDPRVEMERRFAASSIYHHLDYGALEYKLVYSTGREQPLLLANEGRLTENGRVKINHAAIDGLVDDIQRGNIGVVLIDPLINAHRLPENENNAIHELMEIFNKIADSCNCAIGICHHTRKDGTMARGASSFLDALMLCHDLRVPNAEEIKANTIDGEEVDRFMCLETRKTNLGFKLPRSTYWVYKERVELTNGDRQQALSLRTVQLGRIDLKDLEADKIDAVVSIMAGTHRIQISQLIKELRDKYGGLFGDKSDRTIRRWLQDFKEPKPCLIRGANEHLIYIEGENGWTYIEQQNLEQRE